MESEEETGPWPKSAEYVAVGKLDQEPEPKETEKDSISEMALAEMLGVYKYVLASGATEVSEEDVLDDQAVSMLSFVFRLVWCVLMTASDR